MATEWAEQSKYVTYNSWKGLSYYENYKKIANWINGEGELPPPVECSLDPITRCNKRCYFCNSQRYLLKNPQETEMKVLPPSHMIHLVDFMASWGVRGLCIGGGGEPLLNTGAWILPSYAKSKGMQTLIITNGTVMNDIILENMMQCYGVSVSVDAGDSDTFYKITGVDLFEDVIANIRRVADEKRKTHAKVELSYRVLILKENQYSLYETCKLAKELGVGEFHARPVDLSRKDYEGDRTLGYDIPAIMEQLEKCHELETKDFHVYTVQHKFDENLAVKHDCKRCLASPLVIQCNTNGDCSLCLDHRVEARYFLGWHYPNPENILKWWGNDEHRELMLSVNPDRDCGRCTYNEYARQIEEVVIQDKMGLAFP